MTIDYVKLATEIGGNMTDGQEINRLKLENISLKKRTQEAEGELSIVKGIGNNSPEMKSLKSEVAALKQQLHTDRNEYQKNLDKIKKENNDLYNRIAKIKEAELAAHTVQKARESGL